MSIQEEILNLISQKSKDAVNGWSAWDYTSYENGLERFLTLIRWVIENEDQE